MKILIIIPMYNAKKYVTSCFDSIVSQTLKDYEVIAVDDGSTDNTIKEVEKYKDKLNY